jgi:hypothetical protein
MSRVSEKSKIFASSSASSDSSYEHPMRKNVKSGSNVKEFNCSATQDFQSIYKLIEDTFQSGKEEENKGESSIHKTTNEIGGKCTDEENELNEVIRKSEENMRSARALLEKYKSTPLKSHLDVEKADTSFPLDNSENLEIIAKSHEIENVKCRNVLSTDKKGNNNATLILLFSCHTLIRLRL